MTIKKLSIWATLLIVLIVGIAYSANLYDKTQKCDYRTFSVQVTKVSGYSTTTKLYSGTGVYTYPSYQKGQTLDFTAPYPFKIGNYVDQCIQLHITSKSNHPEDLASSTNDTAGLPDYYSNSLPVITNTDLTPKK